MRGTGLRCRRIAKEPNRPNLILTLPAGGDGDGPTLGFLGHLDVVFARREDWSIEPFGGFERDGAIWGRGAVDMKCQVAAAVVALATLARAGFRPHGDIMVLLMADEELAESGVGSDHVVETLPDLRLDYVIGEGAGERYETTTAGPVYLLDHGVKASASVTLTALGRAGDASLQDAGDSAVFQLAELLLRIRDHEPRERRHPALEEIIALLGDGDLDRARAAPRRAGVTIQAALVPGTTADDAIASFLTEHDPEARLVPCLGYGYSDCDVMRKAYNSVAYGFIPFRHADPAVNLDSKHGSDERVLIDDLVFQTRAALHVARTVGGL